MGKVFLEAIIFHLFICSSTTAQIALFDLETEIKYDNIISKPLHSDSLTSSFIIWVKNVVPAHYHEHHTEQIIVLEGNAEMLLGNIRLNIKPGDYLVITPNTIHQVWVTSLKPLKVLSIQSPFYDGTDRIEVD